MHPRTLKRTISKGFTLVELLVVITIIGILVSILIPVMHNVQKASQAASTQSFMSTLRSAIETYYGEFHAYPGPIPNDLIATKHTGFPISVANPDNRIFNADSTTAVMVDQSAITMSENLTLGLLGGLYRYTNAAGLTAICFNPNYVGKGPAGMNPGAPKAYSAYLQPSNLYGRVGQGYYDDVADADDSQIPEFLDQFTNKMPFLYMRAKVGKPQPAANTNVNNWVITYNPGGAASTQGQYDLSQIIGYTGAFTGGRANHLGVGLNPSPAIPPAADAHSIGQGKELSEYYNNADTATKIGNTEPFHGLRTVAANPASNRLKLNDTSVPASTYQLPHVNAYPYFKDPGSAAPRAKDTYILISAGKDRVYGTDDDITTFGEVVQ